MGLRPLSLINKIEARPHLKKITNNIGWLFFDKMLKVGLGIFVIGWIAKYLGPDRFGLINYSLSLVTLFGAVVGLGLKGIVIRDLVRFPALQHEILGTATILQLVAGIVTFLIMECLAHYYYQNDKLKFIVLTIFGVALLVKWSEVVICWFESQIQSKYIVWVQNTVFVAFAAIKIFLVFTEASFIAFVWVQALEVVIASVCILFLMGSIGPSWKALTFKFSRASSMLCDSWPLILSSLAITVYMKIDQIMLGQMAGDKEVGLYSAGAAVSEVWYFIPVAIVSSVFPTLMNSKKKSEIEYREKLQNLFDILVLLACSVAIFLTVFGHYIIAIIYGDAYRESATILAIHSWAGLFVFLGVANGQWFLVENLQQLSLQRTMVGAITNILLNLFMIPLYGAIGAAVATVISYGMAVLLLDGFQRRTRQLFLMEVKSLNIIRTSIALYKTLKAFA